MRFDRDTLTAVVDGRKGTPEGQGLDGLIDLHVRITPELLLAMLGTYTKDGREFEFGGVSIESDGLAYPIINALVTASLP